MASDVAGRARSNGVGSPLPFVLCLVLFLYIGVEKSGLMFGRESLRAVVEASPHTTASSPVQMDATSGSISERLVPSGAPGAVSEMAESSVRAPTRRTSGGGDEVPKHICMLFLFNAILFGTGITQLLVSIPALHGLQQTVLIFLFGVVYSLFLEGLKWNEHLGVLGQSYHMWMDIDPHLLLFTMLPPLLAGDAMTMDTAIARKVSKQWLYLAGPGVLISAFLTALFLWVYLPYDWPFLLCLVTGSILCATDPVAVVALLKELGAPPTLTVQIQGESLLNDGTAIVLFQLSYAMLQGKEVQIADVILFIMKTALFAFFLGLLVGWFFYLWITAASSKLEDHASVIQVALSLCSAYISFIVAEGIFEISGVLSCVAASLVLADKMWPVLVSKESMHTVWEMLEYIGNVIVFFLAGALTGNIMVHPSITIVDYIHVFVIYLVLVLIRFVMLIGSRPLMNYFGRRGTPPAQVSIADCLVMTWGGLRGAVGLALAIQVSINRAGDAIKEDDANRVLFYVGGVAALTLAINATTCPAVVKFLGITALPETKKRVLLMVQEQLFYLLDSKSEAIGRDTPAVVGLKHTLDHISRWIEEHSATKFGRVISTLSEGGMDAAAADDDRLPGADGALNWKMTRTASLNDPCTRKARTMKFIKEKFESSKSLQVEDGDSDDGPVLRRVDSLQKAFKAPRKSIAKMVRTLTHQNFEDLSHHTAIAQVLADVKLKFQEVRPENLKLLGELPEMPSEEQELEVMRVIADEKYEDQSMVRALKEVFLNLVNSQYWQLIEEGEVVPGTSEAEVLLSSIKLARSSNASGLCDFDHICDAIYVEVQRLQSASASASSECLGERASHISPRHRVARLVDSASFNACIMLAIVANAVFIFAEDGLVDEEDSPDLWWVLGDAFFTLVFTIEFFIKFFSLRCQYFYESGNVLDFALVFIGLFSNILGFMAQGAAQDVDVGGESRLVRLARVFRVMRLMRLFRLLQFLRVLKAKLMRLEFSTEVAKHMQTITVLTCFIKAHMHSQREILCYFGTDKKVDIGELARCIIGSEVQTYKAMSLAVDSVDKLDNCMLREVNCQKMSKGLAEQLDSLVHHAYRHSVITSREARSVLHPVRLHLKEMQERIREIHFGYIRPGTTQELMEIEEEEEEAEQERRNSKADDKGLSGRSDDADLPAKASSSKPSATSVKDASVQSSVPPWANATNTVAQRRESSDSLAVDDYGSVELSSYYPPFRESTCSVQVGESSTPIVPGAHSSSSSDIFVGPSSPTASREPLTIGKREDADDNLFTPIMPGQALGLQDA